jgi:hypothetical protein
VPRTVVDLISSRPIHLAIVEGIKTMTGGEGPWVSGNLLPVAPGVIVAGTNPVTTDAVCMSLMGFDPMANRGTPPFERCDSTLGLAEDAGIGTRDLKRIEVIGTKIADARFDFAGMRAKRLEAPGRGVVARTIRRQHRPDDLREAAGGFDWCQETGSDNGMGDAARRPLFPQFVQQVRQGAFRQRVHEVGGARPMFSHAHVERAVVAERDAPLRVVDLERGNA